MKVIRWIFNIGAMYGIASFTYHIIRDLQTVEHGFNLWINCSLVFLLSLRVFVAWLGELVGAE